MCNCYADKVFVSERIFTGLADRPQKGYVAVRGNKIMKVGINEDYAETADDKTQIIQLGEKLVLPGFIDVHTFFTGYAIFHIGADVSEIKDIESCMKVVAEEMKTLPEGQTIYGHGWNPENLPHDPVRDLLNQTYPGQAVILFAADRGSCVMNIKAEEKYGFTKEECYPEAYYRIMKEYLNDRAFIEPEFEHYMQMMNSRGVTTVKEMGFDNFYGFEEFLKEKELSESLSLRCFFMSQPVGRKMDLDYARRMEEKFQGDFVRFSGFNRMVDGTIASGRGDLLKPYVNSHFCCSQAIDYEEIASDVLMADQNGFRWSLHAQGDGAVHKILDIYEKCQKQNGRLKNRHAITDMELTHPDDLKRMGQLGVIGEIYFQIMSLDPGDVIQDNIRRTIGKQRGKYYWNRRAMLDAGVVLSGATDLPLMITNIPESIYHSCGGYFPEGGEPFNKENTIEVAEILKAWTIGGAYNLGMEDQLGTLEVGKLADITVLDQDVFTVSLEEMRRIKTVMTVVGGKIVYEQMDDEYEAD